MKKVLATTALAAALALSLSGCTLGLSKPDAKPAPTTSTNPDSKPAPDASDEGTDATDAPIVTECVSGEPITLEDDNASLEFTGVCGDVTITADNVYANFEQIGNLTVTGDYVSIGLTGSALDVTVSGEGSMVFGNAMGEIAVAGTYNSVSATEATEIVVSGSNNSIAWQAGPANGLDTGTGNAFTGPAQ